MIQTIKNTLYRNLSLKQYLRLLHKGFHAMFSLGLLRKDEAYQYNYFVSRIIKKGDTVIDIGANLGYFTKIFSDLVGEHGRVVAIEPIPDYVDTLRWALGHRKNLTIYHHALGEDQKQISINLPQSDGKSFRTGLPQISGLDSSANVPTVSVQMVKGSELLSKLDRIDYIKIDIEGYEEVVIPEIKEVIRKHQPVLQVETWGTHRHKVYEVMSALGYEKYILTQGVLSVFNSDEEPPGDLLFLPAGYDMQSLSFL